MNPIKKLFTAFILVLSLVGQFTNSATADHHIKVLPTFRGNHQNTGIFPGPAPTKGKLRWKFKAASRIRSSPIVHKGIVYFGTEMHGSRSAPPYLYAVDIASGKLLWKYRTLASIANAAAIAGNTIYVGDAGNTLYAIDLNTHEVKWVFKGKEGFGGASPIIVGQKLYIGNMDDHFYALDLNQNGLDNWTFKARRGIMDTVAYSKSVFFFPSYKTLLAVKESDGNKLWSYNAKQLIYAPAAISDNRIYVGTKSKELHAIDAEFGKLIWKFKAPGKIRVTPAVTKDTIFFGSDHAYFYALNKQDQSTRWKFKISSIIDNSPIIAENFIYFGLADGTISALNTQTGNLLWDFKIGELQCPSGFISDGTFFIGSDDTYLYAIE